MDGSQWRLFVAVKLTRPMDDDELEGAATRSLFRTDSDSDEEGDSLLFKRDEQARSNQQNEAPLSASEGNEETALNIVRRQVMHVLVEEQQTGGTISTQLWPAAEHLAQFVLDSSTTAGSSGVVEVQVAEPRTDHQVAAREALRKLLAPTTDAGESLSIIELGAGIGLTGIELATQLSVKVLLTDLDEGLPLLNANTLLNQDRFRMGPDAVHVQRGLWGDESDIERALRWSQDTAHQRTDPILILGADCVYWESLHQPLEVMLARLLSEAPLGSLCLLAGMRRWKRDNAFYKSLGKRTRTQTHELQCTCLQETVRRNGSEREIMRVYAVQWVQRRPKGKCAT